MPNQNSPKKVVFLTFYYEAWDALAEIHKLMVADPRFEVQVVAVDRRLTGDSGFGGADEVSGFFAGLGIEHLVNADLESLFDGPGGVKTGPDYIFVNYPWQRNYAHRYRPDVLARIGRIVYVPYYSLPMTNEPADGRGVATHLYTQRMHQLASLIFVQDKFVREAYALTGRGNGHVHFVGSTKLDALIEEAENIAASGALAVSQVKTLVWAPHHSYSPHWLNFGNFAGVREAMLGWAMQNPDVVVVLRPHPFLFGTMVDRGVISAADLEGWLARWYALPNTRISANESSARLFATADFLLTDGISYLAEWPLVKGRPGIFLEHQGHWDFSPIGEVAVKANVAIATVGELSATIAGIESLSILRTREIAALRTAAMPFAGEVAERIVEIVAADESELVDFDSVREVAWELQPGREPLD
jgi:hypothetical protein